jgi:hypothetical protein
MSILVKTPMFSSSDLEREVPHKIIPPAAGIVKKPHISSMLEDAYCIVAWELRDLKAQIQQGTPMTLELSKKFEILSRQLASLAAEERKQNEADSLHNLTDEELAALAQDAVKKIGQ